MAFSNSKRLKKWVLEHLLILLSILRWVILSTIIGILVGISSAIFVKTLDFCLDFQKHIPYYFLLLPLGLLFSTFIVEKFTKDAEGHGTEKVIEAIHKKAVK